MFKRILVFICVCMILTLGLNSFVSAKEGISVKIDGEAIAFVDQGPVLMNDRTMVPMRKIFEVLGATIKWNSSTSTVTAVKGDITIALKIGNATANKNGHEITMDVPAQILNGRTMVPLRFVSEAMGATVNWDDSAKTVAISTEKRTAMNEQPINQDELKQRMLKELGTLVSDGTITQKQAEKIADEMSKGVVSGPSTQGPGSGTQGSRSGSGSQSSSPLSSLVKQGVITQKQADAVMNTLMSGQKLELNQQSE